MKLLISILSIITFATSCSTSNQKDCQLSINKAAELFNSGASFDKVDKSISNSYSSDCSSSVIKYIEANNLMRNGNYINASKIFKKLDGNHPNNFLVYNGLSLSYLYGGEFEKVKSIVKQKLKLGIQKSEAEVLYNQSIYANYFLGHLDTATWDVAFLEPRGFRPNLILEQAINNKKLDFTKFSKPNNIRFQRINVNQLDSILNTKRVTTQK